MFWNFKDSSSVNRCVISMDNYNDKIREILQTDYEMSELKQKISSIESRIDTRIYAVTSILSTKAPPLSSNLTSIIPIDASISIASSDLSESLWSKFSSTNWCSSTINTETSHVMKRLYWLSSHYLMVVVWISALSTYHYSFRFWPLTMMHLWLTWSYNWL